MTEDGLPYHFKGVTWQDEMSGRQVFSRYPTLAIEAHARGLRACEGEIIASIDHALEKYNAQVEYETMAMAVEFTTLPPHECSCYCTDCCAASHCLECQES